MSKKKIFYGDDLTLKDYRDSSRIHLREPWERASYGIKKVNTTKKETLKKHFPGALKVVILKTSFGIFAISYKTYTSIKNKLKHIPVKYIVELRERKETLKPEIKIKKLIENIKPPKIISPPPLSAFKPPSLFKPPRIPVLSPQKLLVFNAVVNYIKSHPELRNIDYLSAIDWESEIDLSLSLKENINKIVSKLKKLASKLIDLKTFEIPKEILERKINEVWSHYKTFNDFEQYLKKEEERLKQLYQNYPDIF